MHAYIPAHTHDSQHLRETRTYKRGQRLFGACHAEGGFAEVFVLECAFEGDGPAGLAEACGIEWEHDAHDTGASDDHQYEDDAGSGTGDDMDVASEGSDGANVWALRDLVIRDQPRLSKYMHTHSHTS